MIGGGVFTLIIALFGCFGTLRSNRCLLFMYAIILGILMILEFVGFIMALVYKSKLTEVYEKTLFEVFKTAMINHDTKVIEVFHQLEKTMKCCAVHGASDYIEFNHTIPELCDKTIHPELNIQGCSEAMIGFLRKHLPAIGTTLGVVLLVELVGLIGSIALAVALKHAPDTIYSSNPGDVLKGAIPGRRNY